MEFERLAGNIKFYPDLMRRYETRNDIEDVSSIELDKSFRNENLEDSINNAVIVNSSNQENQDFIDIEQNQNRNITPPKTVQMFDIVDTKQNKKGVIDTIFNEIPKIELPQIKTISAIKYRRLILIFAVIVLILTSFALISVKGTSEILDENEQIEEFEENVDDYSVQDYNENTDGYAKLIPKDSSNIEDFTIKQPISTKPTYSPSITNISWEAPESLVKKPNYTKFLQLTGKNIKLNLQNDLLLVNDIPINKTVKIDINIASNGNVNSIKMVSSSGSEAIDNSIKKVINDTLTYMKPPSHGIMVKPVYVTLTIELN